MEITKLERYYLSQNKLKMSDINSKQIKKKVTIKRKKNISVNIKTEINKKENNSIEKNNNKINEKENNIKKTNMKEVNMTNENNLLNDSVNTNEELKKIEAEVKLCKKCILHTTRTNTVFGKGSDKPKIVFVGEAPGADEDREGFPFVGRGGKLLDTWLNKYNLTLKDIYIMNAIKCRPPENRDPTTEEKSACRNFFTRQLNELKPKIICALGKHGFRNLVETDEKESYGKNRGEVHSYNGVPVIATYHPAFILRSPNFQDKVYEDFELLIKTLEGIEK